MAARQLYTSRILKRKISSGNNYITEFDYFRYRYEGAIATSCITIGGGDAAYPVALNTPRNYIFNYGASPKQLLRGKRLECSSLHVLFFSVNV